MVNLYEVLEVSPNASMEVIRSAYRCLAKKYHPDGYAGDPTFAEGVMKEINAAYAVLGDEVKRKAYNEAAQIRSRSNKRERTKAREQEAETQSRSRTVHRYYPEDEEMAQRTSPPPPNFAEAEKMAYKTPWYAQETATDAPRKSRLVWWILGGVLMVLFLALLSKGCVGDDRGDHEHRRWMEDRHDRQGTLITVEKAVGVA